MAAPGTTRDRRKSGVRPSIKELEKQPGKVGKKETATSRCVRAGRKKMVPSDPLDCLLPDRHARPEHGIRIGCDVGPLLPTAGFIQPRIVALVRVRSPFR